MCDIIDGLRHKIGNKLHLLQILHLHICCKIDSVYVEDIILHKHTNKHEFPKKFLALCYTHTHTQNVGKIPTSFLVLTSSLTSFELL